MELELRVSGDLQDDLETALKAAAVPARSPLEGEGTSWLVSSHSYSYTDNERPLVYTHRLASRFHEVGCPILDQICGKCS